MPGHSSETISGKPLTDLLNNDPSSASSGAKLSRPFQFGSRLLKNEEEVFQFNAWDHVETDDTYKEYAELRYEKQRDNPVSEFDKNRFNSDPARWWDNFYKNNTNNFFKNRKWLQQEFPILTTITLPDAGPRILLEVGAGAGNTAFPILASNQNTDLKIHACDFSKKAVEVIRENEAYNSENIQADVWDLSSEHLPPGLHEQSVDIVMLIFTFSALSPDQWKQAVHNIFRILKPGGEVLFRDYARGDLTQVRFKNGRYLDENFYIRGDGTRVYFFEQDELARIWTKSCNSYEKDNENDFKPDCFQVVNVGIDRRLLVNRAKQLKMYRCWIQASFRKPGGP
ncbi:tRNA-methyltransferase [Golovinomyces cichoracearum]|uniref:tRNA N(3)-methylcytidine methyltransferase n=1 Tax=Golovinomyces cichoracearum TaxID=62708 RepID=A0A420J136_9PEZI|nr:tRNA-methyltransferase [Golovinomyces cichoracearum]